MSITNSAYYQMLMVWKKLTVEKRDVQLPGAPYSVKVHFLDDFVLRGWGYYATCGRRSAGGWATEEGLFAVVQRTRALLREDCERTQKPASRKN